MIYKSTRGNNEQVSGAEAVLLGIAKDGGLFMPKSAEYKAFDWKSVLELSARGMSEKILSFFFDDFPDMKSLVERAYHDKFDCEELTPLVKCGDRYVLELFHGPTSAFKDVALSVLPELMGDARKITGMKEEIVILTATSGDTGKAAMEGFADVEGIRIIVFFPDGGVSPVQYLQMTTQRGNNVRATAIRGNFDDAQTAVKSIFTRVKAEGMPEGANAELSSANSINVGRLVPQIMYYFKAYSDLLKQGVIALGDPVDFTVPTGNFGDILAGYLAKCLGLPVGKLVCASNGNNILTDFLNTGVYDKNRPFYKTVSPSMDILVSSNLERLLYMLSGNDETYITGIMKALNESGRYEVSPEILAALQESFGCGYTDDEGTKATIKKVWEENHYLIDTHTAVAYAVADNFVDAVRPMVVLSTASPYKFPAAVAEAIGVTCENADDEFALMAAIEAATGVKTPENLAKLQKAEIRFRDVVDRDKIYEYVMGKIME